MGAMDKRKQPKTSPGFRTSRRPTVAIASFQVTHIQEAILGVFRNNGYASLDLDALIFFVMKGLEVTPDNYIEVYTGVRKFIMLQYAIEQGDLISPVDRSIRRLSVCYTIEQGQE